MIQKIRNLDPVYYVLYCIFIVFLKYVYFVFSDPGLYRLLPGSIGSTTHQNEKGKGLSTKREGVHMDIFHACVLEDSAKRIVS